MHEALQYLRVKLVLIAVAVVYYNIHPFHQINLHYRPIYSKTVMVSILHEIDTAHEELIHDSQANFYGTRLATASSDHRVKIFDLTSHPSRQIDELSGHEGPVWQIDWSHPEFDNLLASCSYDRKVIIWKEVNGRWLKLYEHKDHDSVNSVQWAPREFGPQPMLACAVSDGSITILKYVADSDWEYRKIQNAHRQGVNAISWAPPISSVSTIYRPTSSTSGALSGDSSAMLNKPTLVKRFVSGGCDNWVKIWKYVESSDKWVEERVLEAHSDWIRDVAWAPSIGLPKWYIASCSQDKRVIIWTNNEGPNGTEWESKVLNEFPDIVWHVSWSVMGNMLAVSCGENQVSLWREDMNGEFRRISEVSG